MRSASSVDDWLPTSELGGRMPSFVKEAAAPQPLPVALWANFLPSLSHPRRVRACPTSTHALRSPRLQSACSPSAEYLLDTQSDAHNISYKLDKVITSSLSVRQTGPR